MAILEPYQQLEIDWAVFNGLDPEGMVACCNGTAALHLALESLGLPAGSRVIVPDFTMVACPRAVVLAGLVPVFVDCDDRLLMDFGLVPPAGQFKVLIAVHVYGRQWPVDGLSPNEVFPVIEDLAEAHGVRPSKRTDAACWSFYANKVVAGAEGGAVWFRDPQHARNARCLRSLGFSAEHDFWHIPRGHNYRMSNPHASLVLDSLRAYEANLRVRRWAEGIADALCPDAWRMPPRDVPWVYDLKLPLQISADGSYYLDHPIRALASAGIAARHSFKPMHEQEEFLGCEFVRSGKGPYISSQMSRRVLYLPLTPGLVTEAGLERAFVILRDFYPA